ncbi:hypothetical protein X975_08517, partial [Stegodyphus mimosarum]
GNEAHRFRCLISTPPFLFCKQLDNYQLFSC